MKNQKKSQNWIVAAVLVLAISLTFWWYWKRNETSSSLVVSLTAPKTSYSIPTIIADKHGIFKKNGLDVNINYVNTGKIAMDDLLGGKADFANIVETNIAFAGFLNPEISVLCNFEEVNDAAIVARKDAGINSPSDLSGKQIGILLATTSQVFADRFLEKYDVDKNKIKTVNLLPPAMQSAIIQGDSLQAVSIWQPYVYNVVKALGNNAIVFKDDSIFTGYMTLAVKNDFLKAHPAVAKDFLKSYLEAVHFINSNPTEAQRIVSEVLNIDVSVIKQIWSEYKFSVQMDKKLVQETIYEGEWIIKTQKSHSDKKLPDYNKFFYPDLLKEVSPKNVNW